MAKHLLPDDHNVREIANMLPGNTTMGDVRKALVGLDPTSLYTSDEVIVTINKVTYERIMAKRQPNE